MSDEKWIPKAKLESPAVSKPYPGYPHHQSNISASEEIGLWQKKNELIELSETFKML